MGNYYVLNTALRLRRPGAASIQIGGFRLNPGVRMPLDDAGLAKHRVQLADLSREGIVEVRDAMTGTPIDLEPLVEAKAPPKAKSAPIMESAPPPPRASVVELPKKSSTDPTNPTDVPSLSEILEMGKPAPVVVEPVPEPVPEVEPEPAPEPTPEPEPIPEAVPGPAPALMVVPRHEEPVEDESPKADKKSKKKRGKE